jgi:hypothetical protein
LNRCSDSGSAPGNPTQAQTPHPLPIHCSGQERKAPDQYCNCSKHVKVAEDLNTPNNSATDVRQVLVLGRIVFISRPDTGISISFVGEKIHCLIFGFTNEKEIRLCLFFNTAKYLMYQILFWWDQSSETIENTFSLSKDDTCVLSQESETTQIQYFWVFKF